MLFYTQGFHFVHVYLFMGRVLYVHVLVHLVYSLLVHLFKRMCCCYAVLLYKERRYWDSDVRFNLVLVTVCTDIYLLWHR